MSKQPPPPPPSKPKHLLSQLVSKVKPTGQNPKSSSDAITPNTIQETSTVSPHKASRSKRGLGWPWDTKADRFDLYRPYLPPHTYNSNNNSSSDPSGQSSGSISWIFNWELWLPPGFPIPDPSSSSSSPSSATTPQSASLEWTPTVRTAGQVQDILPFLTDITASNPTLQVSHLLGFNEPEIPSQSNLPPTEAATLWKQFILPAKQKLNLRLGSPGMSSDVGRSQPWLDAFFAELGGVGESGVEVLVLHWYGLRFGDMRVFLEGMYGRYGLPVWVNEFACSRMGDGGVKGEVSVDEVEAFIREAVPWLDQCEWVERYAYFGNAQGDDVGEWVGRANNFTEVVDGIKRLSRVGELYLTL